MRQPRRYGDLDLYRRLLAEARPYWLQIAGIFLLSLLATPIALLLPLPLQIIVDCVIGSGPLPRPLAAVLAPRLTSSPESLLALAAVLLVVVTLLQQLEGFASWLLQLHTGEHLVLAFRARLFRHVQRLSLLYHDTAGVSESLYRIQYDAPAMQYVVVNGIVPFVTAVVTLASMLYVTARIDASTSWITDSARLSDSLTRVHRSRTPRR